MRNRVWTCLALLVCVVMGMTAVAAQDKDPVGVWSGTWDGTGSGGRFELTLEKNKDGILGGTVAVTGEPTYQAKLKTVSFTGPNMKATYDFPPDERAEVALTAVFDGDRVKGTWSLRGKDGSGEVASGGWVVRKK